jgi:hypothetical protein
MSGEGKNGLQSGAVQADGRRPSPEKADGGYGIITPQRPLVRPGSTSSALVCLPTARKRPFGSFCAHQCPCFGPRYWICSGQLRLHRSICACWGTEGVASLSIPGEHALATPIPAQYAQAHQWLVRASYLPRGGTATGTPFSSKRHG